MARVPVRAIRWIAGDDTGISSQTIWQVMTGIDAQSWPETPADPDDFGRCYRLLLLMPEWRPRLSEVAKRYPEWGPLVREWSRLEEMYRLTTSDHDPETWQREWDRKAYGRMYRLMCQLRDEGEQLDPEEVP